MAAAACLQFTATFDMAAAALIGLANTNVGNQH
jgi:hypothetical protein